MEAEKSRTNTVTKVETPPPPANITPIVQAAVQESFDNRPSPEQYTITPKGTWPPPIYVDPAATEQERHYIEHRWHSQWDWYDKRASEAKKRYQRLQVMISVGAVIVPVLISFQPPTAWEAALPGINDTLRVITVVISGVVAALAVFENVYKWGDNWRNFRGAAEELLREKALYDVKSGPYRKTKQPFQLFVQRCEEIMTKQNGSFLQLAEEVQQGQQQNGPAGSRAGTEDTPAV
jgi:hypothetical protein